MVTMVNMGSVVIIQFTGDEKTTLDSLLEVCGEEEVCTELGKSVEKQLKDTHKHRAAQMMGEYIKLAPEDQAKVDTEINKLKGPKK